MWLGRSAFREALKSWSRNFAEWFAAKLPEAMRSRPFSSDHEEKMLRVGVRPWIPFGNPVECWASGLDQAINWPSRGHKRRDFRRGTKIADWSIFAFSSPTSEWRVDGTDAGLGLRQLLLNRAKSWRYFLPRFATILDYRVIISYFLQVCALFSH